MKHAIICYNCKTLKRYSETYLMSILQYIEEGEKILEKTSQVRVCRDCAEKAGYRVKEKGISHKKILKKLGLKSEPVTGTAIPKRKVGKPLGFAKDVKVTPEGIKGEMLLTKEGEEHFKGFTGGGGGNGNKK